MKVMAIFLLIFSFSVGAAELFSNEEAVRKLKSIAKVDNELTSEFFELSKIFNRKNVPLAKKKLSLRDYELEIMGHQLFKLSKGECEDQYFYWHRMLNSQQSAYLSKKESYKKIRETITKDTEIPWDLLSEIISQEGVSNSDVSIKYDNASSYVLRISKKDRILCKGKAHRYVGLKITKINNKIETRIHESFILWKDIKDRTIKVDY